MSRSPPETPDRPGIADAVVCDNLDGNYPVQHPVPRPEDSPHAPSADFFLEQVIAELPGDLRRSSHSDRLEWSAADSVVSSASAAAPAISRSAGMSEPDSVGTESRISRTSGSDPGSMPSSMRRRHQSQLRTWSAMISRSSRSSAPPLNARRRRGSGQAVGDKTWFSAIIAHRLHPGGMSRHRASESRDSPSSRRRLTQPPQDAGLGDVDGVRRDAQIDGHFGGRLAIDDDTPERLPGCGRYSSWINPSARRHRRPYSVESVTSSESRVTLSSSVAMSSWASDPPAASGSWLARR